MPLEATGFSIVVAGPMNPAIHHPSWYSIPDAISEEERQEALGGTVFLSSRISRFEFGCFRLQCHSNNWQLRTTDPGQSERVTDLACGTFERLRETTITAFGINYDFQGQPDDRLGRVQAEITAINPNLPITLEHLTHSVELEPLRESHVTVPRKLSVKLNVVGADMISVSVNVHHDIEVEGDRWEYFDLTALVRAGLGINDMVEEHVSSLIRTE